MVCAVVDVAHTVTIAALHAGDLELARAATETALLAAPYEDADTLGRLESDVLGLLDPPLNLQGMPATAVRRRLTELRRLVSQKAAPA